ncbi:nucleoside-diphosphate-sugar epimerase [Actinoalloteichus hoggarensis]|uniref:NAD dependent epimerase/dehydratase family protein n=1 Tax=Actinoalloteichus hoggarensis TaxID=1470176 RepID=A0A221W4D0_9PSEU|nr:SDR family oxidoreductase [Actinoalloteichus hoggarensis]ASO20506.1 NAD dependent epimerase/dehydratase family protein [Actinoalloteichus hoggarensis]MBB5923546.1 nucleoside-diphosphate-sugar epimerase [Actinoalloteichus hoggarensis]
MSTRHKVALVVGANGVIGGGLVEHLLELGDWQVVGLSRRGGRCADRLRHVRVDLLDTEETRSTLAGLTDVTHIFYAAYQDRPSWSALVPPNLAMLTNVVDAIEPVARGLEHVSLMQGYKVYGAHLGPFKTPARETDAGHMPPEFNVDQQQFLQRRAEGRNWSWSAIRPSVVSGVAVGNPMNLAMAIAVYATLSRELGLPLRFPGSPGAYDSLLEMTDSGLLAKATVWAATDPGCTGQAFNIGNGDLFRWSELWPKIAGYFDLEAAPPLPMSLAEVMADKEPLWDAIVSREGLAPNSYAAVSSWSFADAVFSWDYDMFGDGSKARRHGFHEYVQTDQMLFDVFTRLRTRRVIP